ncbi:MAG TPA: hypothetical protein VK095_03375 [Beutenbergiaceae bacterium]|uniref:hypothetical protein n=1 Tax=unclassified Georgenia TaxID=2626815 RepID=UPI002BECEC46|nr:hypothetical protein [Georgenia sp. H159]HLS13531.1 hypothetical protein [Beutenbergiaceae bacterium]
MDYVVALLPSIGVGTLFFIVMRAILLADRRERAAMRKFEEAQNSRVAAQRSEEDTDGS